MSSINRSTRMNARWIVRHFHLWIMVTYEGGDKVVFCVSSAGDGSGPADLVVRIQNGDAQAEAELVARYSRGIMLLLRHQTRDEHLAADLHQDVFQIVLLTARGGEIQSPDSLNTFIRNVAKNVAIGFYRKHHRRGEYPDSELISRVAGENCGPIRSLEEQERTAMISQVLEGLSQERDRMILRRVFLDEESKRKICSELDLSPEHFDRVLFRAKQRLRKLILKRNGD